MRIFTLYNFSHSEKPFPISLHSKTASESHWSSSHMLICICTKFKLFNLSQWRGQLSVKRYYHLESSHMNLQLFKVHGTRPINFGNLLLKIICGKFSKCNRKWRIICFQFFHGWKDIDLDVNNFFVYIFWYTRINLLILYIDKKQYLTSNL